MPQSIKSSVNCALLCLVLLSLIVGCKSKQATATMSEEEKKMEQTILNEGYIKAKVVNLKGKDGCGFLLENAADKQLLNPISWPEGANYKTEGTLVWVKYRESRINQTTCLQSKPVVIDEIKLIEK
jgi:hypothetical protein